MIRIFTGDDRIRAGNEIKKILGYGYEVIDCADLTKGDLPQIFQGTTIFDAHRKILLRDFTLNAEIYPELTKYFATPHEVILLETKLDKRSATFKSIKDKIEIKEFKLSPPSDFRAVFDVFKVAKTDGPRAVAMLKKLENTEDPIKFTGLMISQALKDFKAHQGTKETKVLKELSKLDMQLKTSPLNPWLLVESFLLTMGR